MARITEDRRLKQDYLQMRVLELAPQVYASGQLFESDLQLLAKQGVRGIVHTRPDGESPDQPKAADLARAAEAYGITFLHLPVDPASMTEEVARSFMKACDGLDRPLMVCGRSGGQSTKIWETAESF
jgi:sulfide:quinone oxidoreductase